MLEVEFVSHLVDVAKQSKNSVQAKVLFGRKAILKKYGTFADPNSPTGWQIVVKPGISAIEVCKALNLKRCYLISGYVHQTMFSIEVWIGDDLDSKGSTISAEMPKIGKWTLNAEGERPRGELPKLSAGASPAYDLPKYDTLITSFSFTTDD